MIDIEKLNDDQLRIVDKIEREAAAQGLDPRFALAIANIETGGKFQHFDGKKVLTGTSGELGVMQLMPKTAKGLGVNPLDEDDNIRGGVTLLKQLMDEHKDPLKAAVGYNASVPSRNKFYKSGDLNDLPPATLLYVDKLEKLYPLEGEMMKAPAEAAEPPALPEVSSELPASLTEAAPEPPLIDPKTGALVGAGIGASVGAAEAGRDLYKTFTGSRAAPSAVPSASPAPSVAPSSMARAGDLIPTPEQHARGIQGTMKDQGITGRASQTTYQQRTSQIAQQAAAQREAMEKLARKGLVDPAKALKLTEGVSASTPSGILVPPKEAMRLEQELERRMSQSQVPSKISKLLGRIPLGSTLAGLGAGLDVAEAAKRYQEGDIGGAGISGISALGQAAMLAPHPVPRLGGALATAAAMPADYVYQLMRENDRRKKKGLPPITKLPEEIQYDPLGNPLR